VGDGLLSARSVSTTSKVVAQEEDVASGTPMMPPISCPSGRLRKVKSNSGRWGLPSRLKSNTLA
jgi:hypothetical protein